ncbi:MAG: nuclear transport factor 2 family protein [Candidatus Contendobacter sp.]|nr:nuclear transport factor 2 family protein [Candidatus Contendobacter sp.]MDG4556885.1 nuclear transport factor 2 family protein [Candidatus Contendobacter sp.]
MNESANIEMVQRLYADFTRGDIPTILAALDPEVEWSNAGSGNIAYAGMRHGLAQVQEFFATLGASVEIRTFEPREYIAQGDRVAAFGRWTGRVKATGREYASDWAMAWTIRNGRVTAFRSHEDTQAVAAAFTA